VNAPLKLLLIQWLAFFLGTNIHLLMQMNRSLQADSNALRGWPGGKKWLELQAVPILVRGWLSFLLFVVWQFAHLGEPRLISWWPVFRIAAAGWAADEGLDKFLTGIFPRPWPRGLKIDVTLAAPQKIMSHD
jgi:hypothetical protein